MSLDKFSLLLWKNLKIQSRNKCQMFFEILVPILCFIVLLMLFLSLITVEATNEISDKRSTTIILAYSPKNKYIEEYVQKTGMDVIGLSDKNELQQYSKIHKPFAEITFSQNLKDADALPNRLEYSLRFNLNINDPSHQSAQFIKLQNIIEKSFVALKSNVQELPDLNIQLEVPINKTTNTLTQHILPLFIIIGFTGTCISVVKHIMIEKEMQLKESLKMLGLSNTVQWLAWFTKFMITLLIICTVATIVFKIKVKHQIFPESNAILLWVFLLLYSSSLVTFGFMLTTFFSKPNLAAIASGIFFFLTYLPYHIISSNYESVGLITKLSCSLFLNSGMALGIKVITDHESDGNGAKWKNLFDYPNFDNICLFYVFFMLIIATSIHVLITLYVERVFPGDFGFADKWNFPFKCLYTSEEENMSDTESYESVNQENIEAVPMELKPAIEIRNLTKSFSNGQIALENLNLIMYDNQITVLLGKNGAGKTTLMSILTGLYAQTSGSTIINGKDISTSMNSIRKSMGLCPQHNVLFNDLTVKEHIIFFCRLKGMKIKKDIDEEITKYMTLLMLTPKMNALTKTLSGGMKRKLAFAIAFCGKPKVVLFDEPTTGMDPESRKILWDLLLREKIGKTIVLSTHFMDEAEMGDRIAIIANGKLRACGSTFYLKNKFGIGYRLVCVKEDGCNTEDVTEQLKKFIPKIQCETDIGAELSYVLSDQFVSQFQSIFKNLEEKMETLKIASFGISLTTLEEVFLKIGTADLRDSITYSNSDQVSISLINFKLGTPILLKSWKLLLNQTLAMIYKKFLYTIRNYVFVLVQFLIPFVSVLYKIVNDASSKKSSTSYFQIPDTTNLSENINIAMVKDHFPDGGYEDKMYNYLLKQKNNYPKTEKTVNFIDVFFSKGNVTALYNNIMMGPVTVNLMNNALLKGLTGNDDLRIHLLEDTNPYNSNSVDSGSTASALSISNFNMAIKIVVTLSLATAMFITFYIKERVSRSKLLQFVSSVHIVIFWITSFLFDYLLFFLITLIYVFGFGDIEYFMKMYNLLLFFGFAMLPFIYLTSFIFKVSSNGLSRLSMFNILTGLVLPLVTLMVEAKLRQLAKILSWTFSIFPFYSLVMGICSIDKDIDKYLVALFVSGCFFFTMVIGLDYKWVQKTFWHYKKQYLKSQDKNIDSDVADENERVHKMNEEDISDHYLVLKDFTKYYGKVLAVNQICLKVNKGECFGLLGVNGAGKTSIFKMLIGDEHITSGDAWVRGLNMSNEMHKLYKYTGYCPQFDALLEDLTGRETMVMFLLIRGFLLRDVYFLSEYWAYKLNFFEHLDKRVSKLSLGNKRKLSVALAFIGDPSVIFLDEPSSGMDPSSKRKVWNVIIDSRNAGKSVMLSTHSMDECEALCTRLAVMISGQFHCLGSIQQLKDKFSKGFILVIKVLQNDNKAIEKTWTEQIKTFVSSSFVNSYLQDKQQNMLSFHIPKSDIKLSLMFGIIENAKEELNIADYSLSQTSIGQVFLYLSKKGAINL